LAAKSIRVLLADDYEPFRRFVASILQSKSDLQIVAEVSDGVEAVRKTEELQPDLILLDIGLPQQSGFEAARRVRRLSPTSKIIFLSQESSPDFVEGAFRLGAWGYVFKIDAGKELVAAVNAVLRGEKFVSSRLAGHRFIQSQGHSARPGDESLSSSRLMPPHTTGRNCRHEAIFYSDDRSLLENVAQFIGAALKAGNAAIVVATEPHRDNLLPMLYAHGLDMSAAIEQSRYIALDAAETLSRFMHNRMPDPVRFLRLLGDLTARAIAGSKAEHGRVAIFGECVHLLWAEGNPEAAIQVEKLGNELAQRYDVDILCGYRLGSFQAGIGSHVFEQISAEHTLVYSR
jgi:DNA-binding NarL/FixJ family response regulator